MIADHMSGFPGNVGSSFRQVLKILGTPLLRCICCDLLQWRARRRELLGNFLTCFENAWASILLKVVFFPNDMQKLELEAPLVSVEVLARVFGGSVVDSEMFSFRRV